MGPTSIISFTLPVEMKAFISGVASASFRLKKTAAVFCSKEPLLSSASMVLAKEGASLLATIAAISFS